MFLFVLLLLLLLLLQFICRCCDKQCMFLASFQFCTVS
jgi:hypothetical protein